MARPLRIEFPWALYHVMSRGIERGRIVRDDADRLKRLDWLRRTVETYGWRLHAFEEYHWSSCPGYRRASRTLDWVTYDQVLGEFGRATLPCHSWKASVNARRFHYSAREVADALGYRSHGGVRVRNAIARIENADQRLKRSVEALYQEIR